MRAALLALALCGCAAATPAPTPSGGVDPIVAARALGVVFYAAGDRPDFVLHLYADRRVFLVWDDGQRQEHFPAAAQHLPRWNGEVYETANETTRLRVEVRHTPCRDANGAMQPDSVRVVINGEARRGCGFGL